MVVLGELGVSYERGTPVRGGRVGIITGLPRSERINGAVHMQRLMQRLHWVHVTCRGSTGSSPVRDRTSQTPHFGERESLLNL